MTKILLLGAGKTAYYLIEYLLKACNENTWNLIIADYSPENIPFEFKNHSQLLAVQLDINDAEKRKSLIQNAQVVVSLLPAQYHIMVAEDCLVFKKHLLTASYVSPQMRNLHNAAVENGLLFLNEMGLDPGLDHISAMKMLDDIRAKGGQVQKFLSYTGGLMSPTLKDNPWEYKFTWNPEYIVTAGRDGGMYLRNGNMKRIPYQRLFTEIDELEMPGHGSFDAYYNRNSINYIDQYLLQNVPTVIRYTLRRKEFCRAWHAFVNLGLTDNNYVFELKEPVSHREFLRFFIRKGAQTLEEGVAKAIGVPLNDVVMQKLEWLGMFSKEKIALTKGTSAAFLQQILQKKWTVQEHESDAIYMAHVCYYQLNNTIYKRKAYLAVEGENARKTAIAKTVGLPLGIAAVLLLKGQWKEHCGVAIPVQTHFYLPVLKLLENEGITFYETITEKNP